MSAKKTKPKTHRFFKVKTRFLTAGFSFIAPRFSFAGK
jgi:hypothetical protein